jgi:ubiquinone/menaquinone biosynthesis C-methylase UbiE
MDGWVARLYDRGFQTGFRSTFRALAREVLGELIGARRILDVGCGPGQFTVMAAEVLSEADIWGVDLAPTMVALARRHAAASPAAARLHFDVADVAHLPFPDGNFDAVLSTGSIKHWPDQVAGLAEMYRVLRRDGRAFVAEVNRVAPPDAIAAQRARLGHWFFRLIYPRVLAQGLSPAEARAVFQASPFGRPAIERTLLDGCLWLFEAEKTQPAA